MADSYLAYENPSTTDKKLDSESLTVGANTVERERIQIAGTAATDIAPVSATDGLLVNLGANNDVTVAGVATSAKQDTIIGHVDGIEALLGTIDTDTGNISTKIDTLAGAVSGTEMQVDVLTMPTVTVQATNLDIRDIDKASDDILVYANTAKDGSGTSYVPLVDTDGHLQVDILSAPTLTVNAHAVTNAGTFAVQVDGAALTALQLIDNIVLAEDAAHGSADAGVMSLAVRTDSPANKSGTDGDYEPLQVSGGLLWTRVRGVQTPNGDSAMDDVNDALRVNIVAGAGSGGTAMTDDAAFTVGSTSFTPIGGTYKSVRDAVDDNDGGALAMTSKRALYVTHETPDGDSMVNETLDALKVSLVEVATTDPLTTRISDGVGTTKASVLNLTSSKPLVTAIVDGNGDQITSFGGGTQYTEDAAAAANPVGTALMLVREDGRAGSLTSTDGDNVAARGNNKGELYVKTTDSDALLTTIDADTGNISTKIDTIAGAVSGTEIQVDIVSAPTLTVNAHAVTNAGTFAVQVDGAALTALQLIDDIVYTDDTSTHSTGSSKGALIMAAATPTDGSVNANDIGAVAMTTDRKLHVAVMDALPAGTNAIGKLAANSGVDIGDVDVITVTPGTTASALGKAEDAGHSSGDVGVFMLGVRNDTPNTALAGTDLDYSAISTYRTGAVRTAIPEEDFAALGSNHVKKYYTNAGAVTDGIIWSPAAGKRWYVTDIFINVSAAATVTLEDDLAGGDSPVWKAELAANSGWSHHFGTPLFSGEDAADLIVTTSAGNVYITVTGYEI